MARFDRETLQKLHGCKEVATRATKHPGSAVTIWVVVCSTDDFVRYVETTDVGIGTWPQAGLPRWSSTASTWQSRRFQLLTALQSNVPAKRFFRSTGRAPSPHRSCDQRCSKLHYTVGTDRVRQGMVRLVRHEHVSASSPIPIAGRVHAWYPVRHTQLSNSCWPASSN